MEPFKINKDDWTDLKDSEHTPLYVVRPAYAILILRRLRIFNHQLSIFSEGFIFHEEDTFLFERSTESFKKLGPPLEEIKKYFEDRVSFDKELLLHYAGEIDGLEEYLYDRQIPRHFMDLWFELKKDLIRVERVFMRDELAIADWNRIESAHAQALKPWTAELAHEMKSLRSLSQLNLHRLDSIHHYFRSIKDERMAKSLFVLTLFNGVFLPLNLIVGFFGMNTQGMFFSLDHQATSKVVMILSGVFFLAIIGLPLLRFLDHFVLHKAFGRYNFYRDMSKNLTAMSENLKIPK